MKEALFEAALKAQSHAYAPYSNYLVGAAVLSKSGVIYAGCNVENAVYPLGQCAERVAIQSMVAAGEREIASLLLLTSNASTPCGACRQVIAEFADADMPIYIANQQGIQRETTIAEPLPFHFTLE